MAYDPRALTASSSSIWMGDATPGPKTDPEYTDGASCISNLCSENPLAEDLRSSCNAKNTANTVPQVVAGSASVSETVNVATPDDGFVHNGQVQALQKQSYDGATSDQNATVDIKEAAVCLDSTGLASLDATKQKCLTKCATFPFSNEIQDGAVQDSAPTAGQSTSLKLVSAMKGGRAKDGTSPTTKFHVKWAPDVYDPPMTSMSHTAKKSYQQRSKPKKKNHKQKNKAKSSRGGANERKHLNGIGGTSLPRNTRLQAVGDSLLLDEHGKSTAEVLEYAKESAAEVLDYAKESKCGSSFLREALAKMHFSTAEAS
ncbi:hypothetical protein ACMD2_02284 [Ananas comosus]|uniref:Uncharacterized protein n=1 Tax=Ananas comosus TaxID=4615 RepID=A0A199V574_ANACO|nr:hypothetical protein ACMD2_02284 [Ananas comosus]